MDQSPFSLQPQPMKGARMATAQQPLPVNYASQPVAVPEPNAAPSPGPNFDQRSLNAMADQINFIDQAQ